MNDHADMKKTDSLEVRLSKREKDNFLDAATRRNTTASSVMRAAISRYSSGRFYVHWVWLPLVAATSILIALFAITVLGLGNVFASPVVAVGVESTAWRIEMMVVPAADVSTTTGLGNSFQLATILNEETILGQLSTDTVDALMGDEQSVDKAISISMQVAATSEVGVFRYQFDFNVIDVDGRVLETRWTYAVNASAGGVSRIIQTLDGRGIFSVIIVS
ncbi:hypothetical protein [uncultured Maricaulis sp.]|uniref:hypothetical protein n=1 Tax=uncultured Maricaulis sp. TaxID=174710 RepID=UPI0030D98CA9|tara:strand:+ start:92783 stop:93439 length:657 start_codon:yes stop_codon:yes gene_type:complete